MSKHIMSDKIWAWPFNPDWKGGYYRTDNRHPTDKSDKLGAEYTRVSPGTDTTNLIKTCLCCPSDNVRVTEHTVYRIICDKCGAHTRKGKMDEIITLWNEGRNE